jgi:chemotaxis-related protein WspB
MLFLLFRLGQNRYALDALQIAGVLPLVDFKPIPQAPPGIAGIFNYHGAPVPAIDLSLLTLGRPAQPRLSTRVILVNYPDPGLGHERHLLGLIAEGATEILRREAADFTTSGVTNPAAPYLGLVTTHAHELVQWVHVERLLPASVCDVLFQQRLEL